MDKGSRKELDPKVVVFLGLVLGKEKTATRIKFYPEGYEHNCITETIPWINKYEPNIPEIRDCLNELFNAFHRGELTDF